MNKYFDKPPPTAEPPNLRALKGYRGDPKVQALQVEILKLRDGLALLEPRLKVMYLGARGEVVRTSPEFPWDPELEDWLINDQKARAIDIDNEKDRFSLLLRPALRTAIARFGDGYFNSVLIHSLREGPLSSHPELKDVLRSIHEYPPAGGSKYDCEELIDKVLSETGHRILDLYEQDRMVAADILGGAIARYLDDRFSVTNSRMLGFST